MAENKRGRKSLAFFGWPKIKGAENFPKPLYNSKQKRKIYIYRRRPKIKGAELAEGGRKLEGSKIAAHDQGHHMDELHEGEPGNRRPIRERAKT